MSVSFENPVPSAFTVHMLSLQFRSHRWERSFAPSGHQIGAIEVLPSDVSSWSPVPSG